MNPNELREMKDAELVKKEQELRENLFRLKFKAATGELEDTSVIGQARKDIARIKTILTQREKEGK